MPYYLSLSGEPPLQNVVEVFHIQALYDAFIYPMIEQQGPEVQATLASVARGRLHYSFFEKEFKWYSGLGEDPYARDFHPPTRHISSNNSE